MALQILQKCNSSSRACHFLEPKISQNSNLDSSKLDRIGKMAIQLTNPIQIATTFGQERQTFSKSLAIVHVCCIFLLARYIWGRWNGSFISDHNSSLHFLCKPLEFPPNATSLVWNGVVSTTSISEILLNKYCCLAH